MSWKKDSWKKKGAKNKNKQIILFCFLTSALSEKNETKMPRLRCSCMKTKRKQITTKRLPLFFVFFFVVFVFLTHPNGYPSPKGKKIVHLIITLRCRLLDNLVLHLRQNKLWSNQNWKCVRKNTVVTEISYFPNYKSQKVSTRFKNDSLSERK